MASPSSTRDLQELSRLGDGSHRDRLSFRLILRIFLRCVALLGPVRKHVLALFAGFSALALLLLPVGLIFIDTLWTRVLQGSPMLEIEAEFFRVPVAEATSPTLSLIHI